MNIESVQNLKEVIGDETPLQVGMEAAFGDVVAKAALGRLISLVEKSKLLPLCTPVMDWVDNEEPSLIVIKEFDQSKVYFEFISRSPYGACPGLHENPVVKRIIHAKYVEYLRELGLVADKAAGMAYLENVLKERLEVQKNNELGNLSRMSPESESLTEEEVEKLADDIMSDFEETKH